MVGINKNSNIKMNIFPPPKIELLTKMKDLLEDNVENKYYLSEKLKNYVLSSGTKNFKTSTETDLDIARALLSSMHKMHRAGVDNYITYEEKIRKLTPRECLRLMGFTDDFKIVVSDTRMYQQAGNSIIVNIFIEIIKQIDYIMKFMKIEN
jgi:DNA (cytosine-5)-methyltransferase 1